MSYESDWETIGAETYTETPGHDHDHDGCFECTARLLRFARLMIETVKRRTDDNGEPWSYSDIGYPEEAIQYLWDQSIDPVDRAARQLGRKCATEKQP